MLFILKELYGNIFITQEVLKEFEKPIPKWIKVREVNEKNIFKTIIYVY